MSLQGPIVVIGEQQSPALLEAISAAGAFPVIESNCADAAVAITAAHPSAIVLADAQAASDDGLARWLTREITRRIPIVPVVACGGAQAAPAYRESLSMTQGPIRKRSQPALRPHCACAPFMRRFSAAPKPPRLPASGCRRCRRTIRSRMRP